MLLTELKFLDTVGTLSDSYDLIWLKLGMMLDTTECFVAVISDLDLNSRSQGCKKARTSLPLISQF